MTTAPHVCNPNSGLSFALDRTALEMVREHGHVHVQSQEKSCVGRDVLETQGVGEEVHSTYPRVVGTFWSTCDAWCIVLLYLPKYLRVAYLGYLGRYAV